MLLTKEVQVKVNSYTVDFYKSLGYEIPMKKATESSYKRYKKEFVYDFSKSITVKIEDLQKQSNILVEALCDYCNNEIICLPYARYNKEQESVHKVACKKCKAKKQADCNLLKYGVDNYAKTKECHEKMKSTTQSRYGVEYYSQTQEYKDKWHKTCTERYGDTYRKHFSDKALETFNDKTGYSNPAQSPEVKEKMIESCMKHYGVANPSQSSEIKKKMMQSCIEHYGTLNPSQSQKVREKISQTFYANSSQKASKQQCYINNLYQGILNFPVKYYNVDIYLSDDNLTIEYDGGFHDGQVKTGHLTQEEFNQKEIVRNNIIKREGYKQMRIVSLKDRLPQDQVLLDMLSHARNYFSQYPNHSWCEYNIDTSTVRNAEHKDGAPYNYGELRTIK